MPDNSDTHWTTRCVREAANKKSVPEEISSKCEEFLKGKFAEKALTKLERVQAAEELLALLKSKNNSAPNSK